MNDIMNSCFDNSEKWLKDLPHSNVYNYDEINILGDPGSKLVITRRCRNHIENKCNISNHQPMFC